MKVQSCGTTKELGKLHMARTWGSWGKGMETGRK